MRFPSFPALVCTIAIAAIGCRDQGSPVYPPTRVVALSAISGTVTAVGGSPFSPTFSKASTRAPRLSTQRASIAAGPRFTTNRIVVGFKDNVTGVAPAGTGVYRSMIAARQTVSRLQNRVSALASAHRLSHAELSPAILAARFRVDDTTQIGAVMAALRADSNVAWVERDQVISIRDGAPRPVSTAFIPGVGKPASTSGATPSAASTLLPSNPGFFEQLWTAAMLDLPRAWAITTGSSNVIVADVDMGVRFEHQNVAPNFTQDGYDFVSQIPYAADSSAQPLCDGGSFTTIDGDGDGPDPDPTDPDDLLFDAVDNCWAHNTLGDHGLWTSGIVGAVGNTSIGVAGVAWSVKIRPIRVLGITGDGSDFDIAQGILYAAGLPAPGANGALVQAPSPSQIINMSLGGLGYSSTMAAAVAAAENAGSLIVASAGNEDVDQTYGTIPATLPGVMAVAAVGMDGVLTTYSNAGTNISVSAPGGDFRLDDNGGGGIVGPGWDFEAKRQTYLFGYGTSASAPFVSGIAALLLAQNPSLTAAQLRSRIEQFATRPAGSGRSDTYGWGIADAYNSLTQQNGPPHKTYVRVLNVTSGKVVASTRVDSSNAFAFTRLPSGAYYVQAGDDESADSTIGIPGRRFAWAGGFGAPTVFNVNNKPQTTAIALGLPVEVEPNDDVAHANLLSVGSYVDGTITPPDAQDVYKVTIPTAGTYTFETSGIVGSCGLGIELDTFISVTTATGTAVGSNDNFSSATGRFCSQVQVSLTPGIYYVTVTPSPSGSALNTHGRYRLQVRSGT